MIEMSKDRSAALRDKVLPGVTVVLAPAPDTFAFHDARVYDPSAFEAVRPVRECCERADERLRLEHLGPGCRSLPARVRSFIVVDLHEQAHDHVSRPGTSSPPSPQARAVDGATQLSA